MKSSHHARTGLVSALFGGLIAVLTVMVFAVPAQASIIYNPGDNRLQVPNTTVNPYSAVVEITLGYDDAGKSLGACSGWLYGANMVATSAHCLYDSNVVSGGYFHTSGMKVWPGINGSTTNSPFGSCGVVTSYVSAAFVSSYPSYTSTGGDPRVDYGALRLNCSVGNQTGLLNYGLQPTVGYSTRVVGYPSDKPVDTQWYSDDQVRTYDAYLLYYSNDTVKRMSGSPVMEWTGSAWNVVAIHSRDYDANYNIGPRTTSAVTNDLYNWQYYG